MLAVAATAGAIPLARVLLTAMLAWAPPGLPRMDTVAIDTRVLLFCAGIALAAAGMAALAPMLAIVRGRLAARAGSSGRVTADPVARTGRRVLVAGQLAVAVMVVAVTGLLTQSLLRLQAVDAGFDVDRLVLASLAVPQATSSDRDRHLRLLDDMVARLRAAGPIAAATPHQLQPVLRRRLVGAFVRRRRSGRGACGRQPAARPGSGARRLLRNPRRETGSRPRRSRQADRDGALPVAIVSEEVAARTWPGQDPIGRRLKMGDAASKADWLTVVGVARPTRYRELTTQRPVLVRAGRAAHRRGAVDCGAHQRAAGRRRRGDSRRGACGRSRRCT